MRPKPFRSRARGGYDTWLRLEAVDRLRTEMPLLWDTMDAVQQRGLVAARAEEFRREQEGMSDEIKD